MSINLKGGIAPFTGAGALPKTPPLPGQTAAAPGAPNVAPAAAAPPTTIPTGGQELTQLAPGTTWDPSTKMATVPLPWGGSATLDPSQYSVVGGHTYLTPDQWNSFLQTAPYNAAQDVNPQGIQDYASMLSGIMQPVWSAQDAENKGNLQSYTDAMNQQQAQATQGVNTARMNMQTDEKNQMNNALGAQGSQSTYEEGKIAQSYAPQFANLEAGLATDITGIRNTATDAIKSLALSGQTQEAQRQSGVMQDALSYLESTEAATTQERTGVLNYFQNLATSATQQSQFAQTLQEKEDVAKQTAAWEADRTAAEYGPGSPAADRTAAEYGPGSPAAVTAAARVATPTSAQTKQQTQQTQASAESDLAAQWDKAVADSDDPSGKKAYTSLQSYIVNNASQFTAEGVDPQSMLNYLKLLYAPPA